MFSLGFGVFAVLAFTVWGMKTRYPLAFLFCFPIALFTGFYWLDVFDDNLALTVSLMLIVYAFVMGFTAIFTMFMDRKVEE